MKTELLSSNITVDESKSTLTDEKVLLRTPRRSLHPLQKSAIDKENLVGAGRSTNYMTPNKGKLNGISENKSAKKLKVSKTSESKSITVEDLTSEVQTAVVFLGIVPSFLVLQFSSRKPLKIDVVRNRSGPEEPSQQGTTEQFPELYNPCRTTEEPGKEYYKILAEKRRVALEEALKENESLHERVKQLEEENEQCNILLNETRALVETLTEMLKEENENEVLEDEVEDDEA